MSRKKNDGDKIKEESTDHSLKSNDKVEPEYVNNKSQAFLFSLLISSTSSYGKKKTTTKYETLARRGEKGTSKGGLKRMIYT